MKHTLTALLVLLICGCEVASAQVSVPQTGEPQLPREADMPVPEPVSAQAVLGGGQDPFLGGVPSGTAQPGVLPLSLAEVVERGLKYNLGLLLADQQTESARGARWRALSDLLPNVTTATSITREQVDLAAFGISLPGFPTIVGPFNVFQARAFVSQSIFDLNAINKLRARSEDLKAASYSYRDARDLVVVVCVDLYLKTLEGASRIDAAQAQLKTAQALYDRAVDLKKAGVVPNIDVLRSEVHLQAQKQRLIFFLKEFWILKLNVARSIGLPICLQFCLTDRVA
jgi:outer membrane protein TolC